MWGVNPKLLCKKHLLGEHGEIHNDLAKKRSHLITLQIGTKLYWLCFLAVVVCR